MPAPCRRWVCPLISAPPPLPSPSLRCHPFQVLPNVRGLHLWLPLPCPLLAGWLDAGHGCCRPRRRDALYISHKPTAIPPPSPLQVHQPDHQARGVRPRPRPLSCACSCSQRTACTAAPQHSGVGSCPSAPARRGCRTIGVHPYRRHWRRPIAAHQLPLGTNQPCSPLPPFSSLPNWPAARQQDTVLHATPAIDQAPTLCTAPVPLAPSALQAFPLFPSSRLPCPRLFARISF